MKFSRIIFSGIITSLVGLVLGIAIAKINHADQRPNAFSQYATIGTVMGLIVGSAQETIRQLDKISQEEELTSYFDHHWPLK